MFFYVNYIVLFSLPASNSNHETQGRIGRSLGGDGIVLVLASQTQFDIQFQDEAICVASFSIDLFLFNSVSPDIYY
jgi:hypothetical protein